MNNLKTQIEEIKAGRTLAQLKLEDKKAFFKVKSLTEKLSAEKAAESGNFINKQHLVEYRNLIIFMMTRKGDFRGFLNLKEAMQSMLDSIESGKVVYKTEKGIKSIVANLALQIALENSEKNLREKYNIEPSTNISENFLLRAFQQHRLIALS